MLNHFPDSMRPKGWKTSSRLHALPSHSMLRKVSCAADGCDEFLRLSSQQWFYSKNVQWDFMLPLHISAGKVTNQKTSIAFLHGLIGFWRTLLAFRDGSCNVKKSYTNTPGIIFSSIIQGNQTRSNYFTPRMNCLNAQWIS